MSRLAALALALCAALPAVAQTYDDTAAFEARRRELRQQYIDAGSPAEKRAILDELERLDLEARPEEAAARAEAVVDSPAYEEFAEVLVETGEGWTDAERAQYFEAWQALPPALRQSVGEFRLSTEARDRRGLANYRPGDDRVTLSDELFTVEERFERGRERVERLYGDEYAAGYAPPPYWYHPEAIVFHELVHAYHHDHRDEFEEFLEMAFHDKQREWERRKGPIEDDIRDLERERQELLLGFMDLDGVDDEDRARVLVERSRELRALQEDIEARWRDLDRLHEEIGFPRRYLTDRHASDNPRGNEYVAMAAEMLRYDRRAAEAVLSPAEIEWLETHLPSMAS